MFKCIQFEYMYTNWIQTSSSVLKRMFIFVARIKFIRKRIEYENNEVFINDADDVGIKCVCGKLWR